jgi:hypothetical protein
MSRKTALFETAHTITGPVRSGGGGTQYFWQEEPNSVLAYSVD